MTLRVAAVGDLHCPEGGADMFRYAFAQLDRSADVFVICGDLTRRGKMSEIEILVEELAEVHIPVVAVLGNHDYHEKNDHRFHDFLEDAGVILLDGDTFEMTIDGHSVGFTGTKGFAGGFGRRALPDFGEELWRTFYETIKCEGHKIRAGLKAIETDLKVVITHYAPVLETLTGEDPQIYPFLGSSEMAEAIDDGGADMALHGHAHFGQEYGRTPGGVPVRNVSWLLLGKPYELFELDWPSR